MLNFFVPRRLIANSRYLRRFAAFCGVLRRFAAPQKALAIDSVAGPNIWGGSNPRPPFWSVENNRAKMGGQWPPFPLENIFSGFFLRRPDRIRSPFESRASLLDDCGVCGGMNIYVLSSKIRAGQSAKNAMRQNNDDKSRSRWTHWIP